jgi:plasmid stabilization system protein ParE
VTAAYRVVIAARARTAIERAIVWWRANRAGAWNLVLDELEAALAQIAYVPSSGASYESRSVANVRRWLLPGSNYHIYYTVDDKNRVVTMRMLWHASREHEPRL